MKKIALLLFAFCLFAMPACQNKEPIDPSNASETLVIAKFDLSAASTIEIRSGSTGKIQRFTDTDTIDALLAAITPITGSAPVSSRGYYATFYVLTLCAADDTPLLELSLVKPSDHQYFIGHGVYETIHGHAYTALYTVSEKHFDALDSLCRSLMNEE